MGTLHKMVIGKKRAWKTGDKAHDSMDIYTEDSWCEGMCQRRELILRNHWL